MNFHGRNFACSRPIGQTVTLFYLTIVVVAWIIALHGQNCNAADTETPTCVCNSGNTNSSTFKSNLNSLFDILVAGANQTGFNISTYGQNPDQVYGLFQCREDITVDECYTCWNLSKSNIQQRCSNYSGGSVWPFHCFLRYESYNFTGQLDTDIGSVYNDSFRADTGIFIPIDFSAQHLLEKLSGEAASVTKRSAMGTAVDSLSQTIYGLVQCTRDLSTEDCTKCLSGVISNISTSLPGIQYWSQSCNIRYEIYPFFNSTAPSKSTSKTPIILGVVGGFVLVSIVCLFLKYAIFGRRYKERNELEEDTLIRHEPQILFTLETLLAATENFHESNKLGEGGFGAVYKGTTLYGKDIAVKKLSLKSLQGKKEFMNEVNLVAKVQHRNLVNLLGCCAEGLDSQLDWQKRYNIIMGVARGLLYLHQDSQLRIIHRDIKASNVLLDEKLNPKIADFGLARLFPEDETHVSTRVAGTYGYMPPEYAMRGQLSVKTDVYSFGVLLLEIISGRKNTDYSLSPEMQILLGWAWRSYDGGNIVQLIDPAIIETCDETQASRCIQIGLLCTQTESHLRPAMSTVTLMLSTDSWTYLPDPTKPDFVSSYLSQTNKITSSGSSHASATTSSSATASNANDRI
eukprot:PITA_19495